MQGFMSTKVSLGGYKDVNGNMNFTLEDPAEEMKEMIDAGFKIDSKNNVYVREGFGAFRSNIDKNIKSVDDLRTYFDEHLKKNPYQEVVELMDKKGYEWVIGPEAPQGQGTCNGLYCKNYLEIAKQQEQKQKSKTKEEGLKR